ncbi:uncharacterized protein LOC142635204 [Castanea sativa]|uniref:uncharacterized protein LOC142635204 n=1 Tax=Castanea sativa TaxID=21020 RepID=UPI003F64FCBC
MNPIVLFLKDDILPKEKGEADKVRRKVADLYLTRLSLKGTSGRGLDVGPFPKAAGNKRWLLVCTDYFTKWVEAEPLSNIKDVDAKRFGNGQAETVNKVIVNGLKKRLDDVKGNSFTPSNNDKLLEKSLDLIEERRENAMVQLAYYQHKLKQGYDSKVKLRPLAPGDLVLRKVLGTAKNLAWGKLGPNWEGSYRITSVAGIWAYYLEG